MEQPPDAKRQVDLERRLVGVERIRDVDLHDGRRDLKGPQLGTVEVIDEIDDESWV